MGHLLATVAAAAGMFAGTNADDIVVLTVLFLSARACGTPKAWQIVAGQYAGIAALVTVSAGAALGLMVVPDPWVGLLGVVAVALGLRRLVWPVPAGADGRPTLVPATGLASVAGVTVVNGGDNVAIYTPVFRAIGVTDSLITIVVFAVMVTIWCAAGGWLGSHRRLVSIIERWGHWLVPSVFIVAGTAVLVSSGVVSRLVELVR